MTGRRSYIGKAENARPWDESKPDSDAFEGALHGGPPEAGVQQEFPMVQETPMAAAFRKFHEANPWVLAALVQMALEVRATGRTRWSIANLFEVLRWKEGISTSGRRFVLNNNYRAFYARMVMRAVPALDGFFHTRGSEADE